MFNSLISFLGGNNSGKKAVKAILLAGILSIAVRLVGFIKESTIAYYFGVSENVDFYVLAFVFATFFVQPIGGAIATLLTQKYIEVLNFYSSEEARQLYLKCLTLGILCICIILLIQSFLIKIPYVESWLSNKFSETNLNYIYFLLPLGLFSLISVINNSILMAKEQFNTYSLLPIIIHFTTITFLIFSPTEYVFEYLLIGTTFGFFMEFIISQFCVKDVLIKLNISKIKKKSNEFYKILKSMPNMVISGTIMGSCLIVDQVMALLGGEGAVAMINFGNKVPLGLISVITIWGSVLYPTFVKYATKKKYDSLRNSFLRFSTISFLILLPICICISFFSDILIKFLFERGEFLTKDTLVVANIQTLYLLFVPLFVVSMICMRVINALENTRIYLLGNSLLLIMNIILNLYLIPKYGVIGAPLSTLISYGLITVFWVYKTNQLVQSLKDTKIYYEKTDL